MNRTNIFSIPLSKAEFLKEDILEILSEHGISKKTDIYYIVPTQGPHLEPTTHDINVLNHFLIALVQRGYMYLMVIKNKNDEETI